MIVSMQPSCRHPITLALPVPVPLPLSPPVLAPQAVGQSTPPLPPKGTLLSAAPHRPSQTH